MHHSGTAGRARRQPGPISPVISGENGWLGDDGRDQPLTLQLSLPVSAVELAAALYHDDHLTPADLAKDHGVWALAALAIIQDGLNAIQHRADEILAAEARGALANPAWLELCRRRVAEVTGSTATGPAAVPASAATTTASAGALPAGTTTFPRPRTPEEETAAPGPRTRAEGLAQVRALTEIASPCRAGN
jgi:hypothetical protein